MNFFVVTAILVIFYVLLIWKSGKTYPILYMFFFTFFLQYIYSTYLIYNNYAKLKSQMPIRQEVLFDFAIPAVIALFLGIWLFNTDYDIRNTVKKIDPIKATRLGYFLLFISYGFDFMSLIGIGWFGSLTSFTYYLKFLAVFCFLFTNSKFLYFLSSLIYGHLVINVLGSGVFIDLIIWGVFLFFFISLRFRLSFFFRGVLFLSAVPLLILIQSVKDEYRKLVWSNKEESGIALFAELAQQENERQTGPIEESKGVVLTVARLSQGWHLGLTLKRVPQFQPFADGQEMLSDIGSAILPRFLFPEKKVVHTKEKFYRYTGHKLKSSTSMTIGILGDFYVNFGKKWSLVMLFVFGAMVSRIVAFFNKNFVQSRDPINIVWVPFIFSYLIRADNDFYIFLNCLIKGFIIFLVINYIRYQLLEPKKMRPVVGV